MPQGQNRGQYGARTWRILAALERGESQAVIAVREGVTRQWVRMVEERARLRRRVVAFTHTVESKGETCTD